MSIVPTKVILLVLVPNIATESIRSINWASVGLSPVSKYPFNIAFVTIDNSFYFMTSKYLEPKLHEHQFQNLLIFSKLHLLFP